MKAPLTWPLPEGKKLPQALTIPFGIRRGYRNEYLPFDISESGAGGGASRAVDRDDPCAIYRYMEDSLGLRSRLERVMGKARKKSAHFTWAEMCLVTIAEVLWRMRGGRKVRDSEMKRRLAQVLAIKFWPDTYTLRTLYPHLGADRLDAIDRVAQELVFLLAAEAKCRTIRVGLWRSMAGSIPLVPLSVPQELPVVTVESAPVWTDVAAATGSSPQGFDPALHVSESLLKRTRAKSVLLAAACDYGNCKNVAAASEKAAGDRRFRFVILGGREDEHRDWWERKVMVESRRWIQADLNVDVRELGCHYPWGKRGRSVRVVAIREGGHEKQADEGGRGKVDPSSHRVLYTNIPRRDASPVALYRERIGSRRGELAEYSNKFPFENRRISANGNRPYVKLRLIAETVSMLFESSRTRSD